MQDLCCGVTIGGFLQVCVRVLGSGWCCGQLAVLGGAVQHARCVLAVCVCVCECVCVRVILDVCWHSVQTHTHTHTHYKRTAIHDKQNDARTHTHYHARHTEQGHTHTRKHARMHYSTTPGPHLRSAAQNTQSMLGLCTCCTHLVGLSGPPLRQKKMSWLLF